MSLRRLLGLTTDAPPASAPALTHEVRSQLSHLPDARVEVVTAFAGLLMRVAHADDHVSPEEDEALRRLLAEHAGLGSEESDAVTEIVTHHLRSVSGIEYALLTRAMNDHGTLDDKLHLIDCLYAIATADAVVSVVEDEEIKAVARALMLSHSQLIDVRRRYADQLEVLQAARRLRD